MSSDWIQDTTSRVGQEVKRLRGKRSAQWLADRTKELGSSISRSTISELETGKRKSGVTVQELVVLALALDVPPVQLLYPEQPYGPVEFIPDEPMSSVVAADVFSGITAPQFSREHRSIDVRVMQLARQVRKLDLTAQAQEEETLTRIVQAFQDTPGAPDINIADLIASRVHNARSERQHLIRQIEELLGQEVAKEPPAPGSRDA